MDQTKKIDIICWKKLILKKIITQHKHITKKTHKKEK